MPSSDASRAAARPDVYVKKVSWLELFFDVLFALALAMSAKPLEQVSDLSTASFMALGQFILVYIFLIMFWYKHLALINRFDHQSFLLNLITLFIGFLVIAFTQFIKIWLIEPALGSFLATITISLIVFSIAGLYFLSSIRIVHGDQNQKMWARASAKHMFKESLGYFSALIALTLKIITPSFVPFWFIIVFLYFNRYPFVQWINPKAPNTLPPELQNVPMENIQHKTERIGLFALLVYGLVIVLAATPLVEIDSLTSAEGVLGPIVSFGKIFLFISVIWYLYYRLFEMIGPKGHQFTAMTFVSLALLVATTQFIRFMLVHPSNFISVLFAISTGLLLSVIATAYFNAKMIAGVPPTENILAAFKQWAYLLYTSAAVFFASVAFASPIREKIWTGIMVVIIIGLLIERRLIPTYYMGSRLKTAVKFFDSQTSVGLTLIVLGLIIFFVLTTLLQKPIASLWIFIWAVPLAIGFFVLLNHWLHTRIRPT